MIVGVPHAQVTIPMGAEEAGREFYCGFLGLEEVAKPASPAARGGFWFRAGPFSVHVRPEDGVDRHASKAHLAYEVTDLAEWRRRLGGRGIRTEAGLPIPGHDRLEFRDPFGNRVELIERLSGRTAPANHKT